MKNTLKQVLQVILRIYVIKLAAFYQRKDVCSSLTYLGVKLDEEKNNVRGEERIISADDSKVQVLLVPTNEELAIARETLALVK